MPDHDARSMDLPVYREMRVDLGRADACVGPGGERPEMYLGSYKGTWSGQVVCSMVGFSFNDQDSWWIIELGPLLTPNTLKASGSLSINNLPSSKSFIDGTMDCFVLTANITLAISFPGISGTFNGTMQGVFQPTWGVPPHFGEGTWQISDPSLGCKGYGTWRGAW
jgi:hypothetical protein